MHVPDCVHVQCCFSASLRCVERVLLAQTNKLEHRGDARSIASLLAALASADIHEFTLCAGQVAY